MSRTCSICRHDERTAIDQALVAGVPQRQIAEAYRASRSAIARHSSGHVAQAVQAAAVTTDKLRAMDLVGRMAALVDEGEGVLRAAREGGPDGRLMLAAIREVRETLAVLAKLMPEPSDEFERDVRTLVGALHCVLPRFPEAAAALSSELAAAGTTDVASAIGDLARR